jgi:hypothetical protein
MRDLSRLQPFLACAAAGVIPHLKPSKIETTLQELAAYGSRIPVSFLQNHQIFDLSVG